jgi:hypothetical protein
MKRHHFGLAAGAVLLVAAQDVPTPPAQDATFSEAFTEQSDAAEAVQTAQALDEPTAEPTVPAAETPAPPPETAVSPTEPGAALPKAAKPAGEAAPAAAIPAKGEPPTREFMVGIWAEPGEQCEAAMDFKADGTLIGPFPRWELTDGVLTMVGNRQKIWLTVIDQDTMQSRRSETDPPRTLKRCPKAPPPPQP